MKMLATTLFKADGFTKAAQSYMSGVKVDNAQGRRFIALGMFAISIVILWVLFTGEPSTVQTANSVNQAVSQQVQSLPEGIVRGVGRKFPHIDTQPLDAGAMVPSALLERFGEQIAAGISPEDAIPADELKELMWEDPGDNVCEEIPQANGQVLRCGVMFGEPTD